MRIIKDLGMMYANETSKQKHRYGLYECPTCKKQYKAPSSSASKAENCKQCTIKLRLTTHGLSKSKIYNVWTSQVQRCTNKKSNNFKHYGERGIIISEEFKAFDVWFNYINSLPNAYKVGYSIDRINNDIGYVRNNLRWADRFTQSRNTRRAYKNNTSGYRCVSHQSNKFIAYIRIKNKRIYLGSFDYPWTAAYAYDSYVLKNNLEHARNFKC